MVPQQGIEPHSDAYKTTVIPIYYKGLEPRFLQKRFQKLTHEYSLFPLVLQERLLRTTHPKYPH